MPVEPGGSPAPGEPVEPGSRTGADEPAGPGTSRTGRPGERARAGAPAQRVAAPAVEPLLPTRSADDSDDGWGGGHGSADDRLLRDVPPHW